MTSILRRSCFQSSRLYRTGWTGKPRIKNQIASRLRAKFRDLVGGPGVKPGFAASDATVLFSYTTHPSGTRAGNPTRISSLGPKRHHGLDHASLTNVEGMQRIEL